MKKAEKYDELLKKYNIQDSRDLEKVLKVYYQQSENVTAEEVEISEELMVQYGISSMEEFTKARELNVFKENFVHVSESDQSKFDYVKGILERSKNAIFAYLELLPEYDVSEPVNLTNTIFIIKKYGKEIVLITRPSDYEHGFPVTIIEALNLNSLNKAYLDKHIDKIYNYDTAGNKFNTIIEQIQKTAQKILRFVLHPRTKRIQNFKSVVLWRTHLCRISNLLIYSLILFYHMLQPQTL